MDFANELSTDCGTCYTGIAQIPVVLSLMPCGIAHFRCDWLSNLRTRGFTTGSINYVYVPFNIRIVDIYFSGNTKIKAIPEISKVIGYYEL